MAQSHHAARHTFYYLLVLVTLGFTAIGVGQILFQIINASFPESVYLYDAAFDQDTLRFGMTAVIVGAPLYWLVSRSINKELAAKALSPDSLIRKWLTYLILFVASIVLISDLMTIIYNFLSGELTIKFIFKALTVLLIAGLVFWYYLTDIKREDMKIGNRIKIFRIIFLVLVLGSLVGGMFFLDSPAKVRAFREDQERVNRLRNLGYEIQHYATVNNELPSSLDQIKERTYKDSLVDPVTNEAFEYRKISETNYELCAEFAYSNREESNDRYYYRDPEWIHDEGRECFEKTVTFNPETPRVPREVPLPPSA